MLDPQPVARSTAMTASERDASTQELNLDTPVRDDTYRQDRVNQARAGAEVREYVGFVNFVNIFLICN